MRSQPSSRGADNSTDPLSKRSVSRPPPPRTATSSLTVPPASTSASSPPPRSTVPSIRAPDSTLTVAEPESLRIAFSISSPATPIDAPPSNVTLVRPAALVSIPQYLAPMVLATGPETVMETSPLPSFFAYIAVPMSARTAPRAEIAMDAVPLPSAWAQIPALRPRTSDAEMEMLPPLAELAVLARIPMACLASSLAVTRPRALIVTVVLPDDSTLIPCL